MVVTGLLCLLQVECCRQCTGDIYKCAENLPDQRDKKGLSAESIFHPPRSSDIVTVAGKVFHVFYGITFSQ